MAGRKKSRTSIRAVQGSDPVEWVKPPAKPPVDINWDEVAAIDIKSSNANHLPVTGRCYDCNRRVSGERRYCGPCLNKH